jgi:hypothetical protein
MDIGMINARLAREAGYGFSGADLCNFMVAGEIRPESNLNEAGNLIGENFGAAYRIKRAAIRQKRERSMSLRSWLLGEDSGHEKYERAISLADEVTGIMRSRSVQRDPLKAVLADMFFATHDPALVADAFEISQEARIYRGTEH